MRIKIDNLLDDLVMIDPENIEEVMALDKKYNCDISCSIEKHNPLQFTYYYEIDFGKKENYFIEIENGINNGTRINTHGWGCNSKPSSRTIKILKNIVLDESFYKNNSFLKRKAQTVLNANKGKLFEFHRKNNYDNYVTGGNSKMKLNSLLSKLELEYIYENQEVDCNFI